MKWSDIIIESHQKPLAVIVKGNPRYLRHPDVKRMADAFYADIRRRLAAQGFRVAFDPGKPYTSPDAHAAVWVGHFARHRSPALRPCDGAHDRLADRRQR